MISLTGKHNAFFRLWKRSPPKGFSFFEVMVTVSILALGIVVIYQAFFISLNYANRLTIRLYANWLLDHKIANLQYYFKKTGEVPEIKEEKDTLTVNNKTIDFHYNMHIKGIEQIENIFELATMIYWLEQNRTFKLIRVAYLAKY